MTEKISDILFHPSTLIKYKNINIFKALLFLLFLGLVTAIVPIINTYKFVGFSLADKPMFEKNYGMDFSDINNIPNCAISNNQLTCETNDDYVLLNYLNLVSVVIDVDGKMKPTENQFYIRLTEKNIKVSDSRINLLVINYDELPKAWQSLNFKELKSQENPEFAYYNLFASGISEIRKAYLPYEILINLFTMVLFVLIQVLFYSFIFFIIVGRKTYKFKEVFKVATFAYTLPVIIGLFFSLLNIEVLNSTILAVITIIYIHIALVSNKTEPENLD